MIRLLRQRHRRTVVVLGILLPAAFVVGVSARKPIPCMASLPVGLSISSQPSGVTIWQRDDLYKSASIQVRLLRDSIGRFAIAFSPVGIFAKPDLIVYWVPASPASIDALPDNAHMLGSFESPSLTLPDESATTSGSLILYSLADQEVVNVSVPARFNDSTR